MTNTKMNARTARQMVGCTISHNGTDLVVLDVRHMGVGGWMMKLSNGAMLRPSEIQ